MVPAVAAGGAEEPAPGGRGQAVGPLVPSEHQDSYHMSGSDDPDSRARHICGRLLRSRHKIENKNKTKVRCRTVFIQN